MKKKTLTIVIHLTDEESEKLEKWEEKERNEIENVIWHDVKDFIKTMGKR